MAATTGGEVADLVEWISNHGHVCNIFDDCQKELVRNAELKKVVSGNLTRWTTHSASFNHTLELKESMRRAVILSQPNSIAAQVGAEKNKVKAEQMTVTTNNMCNLIDSGDFWTRLEQLAHEIEPICYGTNINQSDKTRPDQVLLTFAGIYLHFKAHPDLDVSFEMVKHVEKRWKDLDQDLFVTTLVLNPFEHLARFGDQAGINPFSLNTLITSVCGFPVLKYLPSDREYR